MVDLSDPLQPYNWRSRDPKYMDITLGMYYEVQLKMLQKYMEDCAGALENRHGHCCASTLHVN